MLYRDCTIGNIMMDARAMYPEGWHPLKQSRTKSGLSYIKEASAASRTAVGGVRYYLIDYHLSEFRGPGEAQNEDRLPDDRLMKLDVDIFGNSLYDVFLQVRFVSSPARSAYDLVSSHFSLITTWIGLSLWSLR